MAIAIACPNCRTRYKAPDRAVGRRTACTRCRTVISIPGSPLTSPDAVRRDRPERGDVFPDGCVELVAAPPEPLSAPQPLPLRSDSSERLVSTNSARLTTHRRRFFLRVIGRKMRQCVDEVRNSAREFWDLGVRVARYGRGVRHRIVLGRKLAEAEYALGQRVYDSGGGVPSVRAAIDTLDERIRSHEAARRPCSRLRAERRARLARLAETAVATETSSADVRAVETVRAELKTQRQRVSELRRGFLPTNEGRRRVAVGSAVVGLTAAALVMAVRFAMPAARSGNAAPDHSPPVAAPTTVASGPDGRKAAEADPVPRPISASSPPRPDPPDHSPAVRSMTERPVVLAEEMTAAGFTGVTGSWTIEQYVRFGSRDRATKLRTGDQFTQKEFEAELAAHARRTAARPFRLPNQPIVVPKRADFDARGLFVRVAVPFRLDVDTQPSGAELASSVHVYTSWANAAETWFLTKEMTLLPCRTPADVAAVRRIDGHLYLPESRESELILNLRTIELDRAKDITRTPHNYRVDLVIQDLRFEPAYRWGYFHVDELANRNWDCRKIMDTHDVGLDFGPTPAYFQAEVRSLPWLVRARLVSAELKDTSGAVITAFRSR